MPVTRRCMPVTRQGVVNLLIKHRNSEPRLDKSAFIAPTAVLAGKITVGPRSRIMYGAVVDSEASSVEIGECTIICENAVVRATSSGNTDHPVLIGDNAFIGPHATLLGCTVESGAYVATGATILQGATVHSGAVVTVGALVHANAVVPAGFFVPPYNVAVGNPARIYSPDEKEAMAKAIKGVGFANTAFGIQTKSNDPAALYKQTTEVRSEEFAAHFKDTILE